MKKYLYITLILTLTLLTGCNKVKEINNTETINTVNGNNILSDNSQEISEEIVEIEETIVEPEPEPEPEVYELTLMAAGDNLIHSPIYNKASNGDGTYNFSKMYENVKELIQSYDIAVINEETVLIEDDSKISSYPCFGTPIEMGNALIDTGFDVILSATNHTWDKGISGVKDTLNFYKNYPDITLLGVHETEEDYNTIDIIEKNNIKLAMFNYTYGTNGITVPDEYYFMVDRLDNKEKFINDVVSVENEVDFTICFLHIGTEYVYKPTEYQINYVNELIDAGADIIICAHPHVIEPYNMITTDNGNTGLVYYSCGNFISNQNEVDRTLGGLASLKIKKTIFNDEITNEIIEYDFIPVVTHYNKTEHSVYLLDDYNEELAKNHTLRGKGLSVDGLWELWDEILNTPIK